MKKKIISDVFLNIIASTIPILILQFFLLPLVASNIDSDSYGYQITIVAWMNLSAITLGNVLNNSRLIYDKSYEDLDIKGDFKILLGYFLIINVFVMLSGFWFFEKEFDLINIIVLLITSILLLLKEYGIVEFRIKLNYKYILFNSLYTLLGYGIGLLLFLLSEYWQFIYLCGTAFSFIFVLNKTNILREPMKKTPLFKKTTSQTFALLISGILNATTVYIDKLLLYPLLGGVAVSVYYTATILGKTIALMLGPITGVFLSYIARLKKIDNKNLNLLLIASLIGGTFGYIIVITISKPLLYILYPKFAEQALNYIYITTLAIIITVICDILNTVILKFCDMKWQILINAFYLVLYISLSLTLLYYFGIIGYCLGILFSSILKLFAMMTVYYLTNIKKHKKLKHT